MTPEPCSNWLTTCTPGHGLPARGGTADILRANCNPAGAEATLVLPEPMHPGIQVFAFRRCASRCRSTRMTSLRGKTKGLVRE